MRRFRKGLFALAAVAFAAMLGGCFKKVVLDCRYNIRPYIQMESGGEVALAEGVVAYAFMVDTTQWTVASYEDALNGVLTSKTTGEKRSDATERAVQQNDTVALQLKATPATIIVVDPINKLYGWRMTEVAENLPNLYVSITFRPWSVKKVYVEGPWRMNNEAYVAPEPETPDSPTDPDSTENGNENNEDNEGSEGGGSGSNEGQYSPAEPLD